MSYIESDIREILSQDVSIATAPAQLQKLQTLSQEMVDDADHMSGDNWSHSVCHLFENYSHWHTAPSFLNDTAFFPAATILVNKAVELGPEKAGCLYRIIGPIIQYNLDAAAKGVVDQFAFKPESLSSPILQQSESGDVWSKFAKSETPREFLKLLTDDPAADFAQDYYFESITQALEQTEGSEAVAKLSEKIAAKLSHGAYIDVEGTLIDNKGAFNPTLGTYITYLLDKGIPVTVFTGGDTEALTETLAKFGLDERVLPVRSKGDFKSKHLEVSIDDTNPSYQGFTTELWARPFENFNDSDFTYKLMGKWGAPEVPAAAANPVSQAITTTPAIAALKAELGEEPSPSRKGWRSLFGLIK